MQIKIKQRRVKDTREISKTYDKLRDFRIKWEAAGGTRGSLRLARKKQQTLYPVQA